MGGVARYIVQGTYVWQAGSLKAVWWLGLACYTSACLPYMEIELYLGKQDPHCSVRPRTLRLEEKRTVHVKEHKPT